MQRIQFTDDDILQLKHERLLHEHPVVRRRMMALNLKSRGPAGLHRPAPGHAKLVPPVIVERNWGLSPIVFFSTLIICGLNCLNSSALYEPWHITGTAALLKSTYLIVGSLALGASLCGRVGSMLGTGSLPVPPAVKLFG
jgi:hypothetical protein